MAKRKKKDKGGVRIFNGKQYAYTGDIFLTKNIAQQKAGKLRKQHYLVRVIPTSYKKRTFWKLYYAPK